MKHRWFLLLAAVCAPTVTQAYNDTIIRHFTDTIPVVTMTMTLDSTLHQREVVIPSDSSDLRGHYIEAHVGLGYGSLGYKLDNPNSSVTGSFSGLIQLQYAYFFHPNWGIGAGVWFTNYTSQAHWGGDFTWKGQTDTDGESPYDHTATVNSWRERQTLHNIGIPVSLQFQYQKENWKARIFASIGVAPAFSVSKRYNVRRGEIAHSGYYPAWDLTLSDMHEFQTKDYTRVPSAKGELSVRPQAAVFADFGALLPLTRQIDLFLGGYFNCAANDANASDKTPLGWKDETFTFMDEYKGAYATDLASASHPWEAGLKVGIHWHHIPAPKHQTEDYYEYFLRPDTTYRTEERADTVITVRPDPMLYEEAEPVTNASAAAYSATEEMKFNKIYFDFDRYDLTARAQQRLDRIAEALNQSGDAPITLHGHASPEGDPGYNARLSLRRAKEVAAYLVSKGVDKQRIRTVGHGADTPNEEEEIEQDDSKNRDRRVEIFVETADNNHF